MPLTLPSVSELVAFRGLEVSEFSAAELAQTQQFIQLAADLLYLATELTEDPLDPALARMVKWGIMDMAWYLGASMEDRDAMFSPFSSERVGSYSYSKSFRAVSFGAKTGVPFFDILVAALANGEVGPAGGMPFASAGHVMPETLESTTVYLPHSVGVFNSFGTQV